MPRKTEEWCNCDNPQNGIYYHERGEQNSCSCSMDEPHMHCRNCGGLIQVS